MSCVAVLTIATPALAALGRLGGPNLSAYCRRHGYAFVSCDPVLDESRRPVWWKILLLLAQLDRFDWLFWADADGLVMDSAVRVEDLARADESGAVPDLVISREHLNQNPGGVNSGYFLVRPSPAARAFLEAVYRQTRFLDHPYPEQTAMDWLLRDGRARREFGLVHAEVPKRVLNADIHDYQPGDFILHFRGQPARAWLMRKYLAKLSPEQGGMAAVGKAAPQAATAGATPRRGPAPPALTEAMRLHRGGRHAEAEALCRTVLDRGGEDDREDARAVHLLGLALHEQGRYDEAYERLCRSIDLSPATADYWMNLGSRLAGQGHTADAAELFREAIRLRPTLAAAHDNLGAALLAVGDAAGAVTCHERAIELRPMDANAHAHRGKALLELKRAPAEAVASLAQAIRLKPDHADAHAELSRALQRQMRVAESVAPLRRAVELRPWDAGLHSGMLFVLNHVVGDDRADLPGLFADHLAWADRHARPLYPAEPREFPDDRDVDRPLRVGYLSPDLRDHACARFIEPLLAGHDPAAVELVVYSDAAEPDAVTERLKGHVAAHPAWRWRDVAGVGDRHLEWIVRNEDRIDVLVDLAGHTSGHRLQLLARRVAPVQATYMGYPNTTGVATVDWRITDAHADPLGATEEYNTERLLRLDGCGYSFQPPAGAPDVSALPALRSGEVTFGCLNRPMKLNARVARLWAELVKSVPGSRLLVLNEHGPAVGELFARAGMPPGRLLVARPRPTHHYLTLYHGIDIALDPFPYGGMTTTCDALWMGVPVVTLAGPAAPSRAGVSLLNGVGHPEWVATTPREYVALAASLANDLPALSELRGTLRTRMAASPLCDGAGLSRKMESAFWTIWRQRLNVPA